MNIRIVLMEFLEELEQDVIRMKNILVGGIVVLGG